MTPLLQAIETPMELAGRLANLIRQGHSETLQQYTRSTELGPIALIDRRLLQLDPELITALLQTILSLYCGKYLVAVNLAMHVDNVRVMSILNTFGTNNDMLSAAGSSAWLNGNEKYTEAFLPVMSNEAYPSYTDAVLDVNKSSKISESHEKVITTITDESNLVVGKMLNIQVSSIGPSNNAVIVNIPVRAVLYPKAMDSSEILAVASFASKDVTMKGRWRAWRSGEIEFLKDYLLAMDMVEAHKKAANSDKTGTLLNYQSGKFNNLITALIRGQASPNNISTTIIISKQTANEMRLSLKGDLNNYHIRENYFKGSALATIVVVDHRTETFTIYYRGIDDYGIYTLSDIKKNSKQGNGVDIKSVIKAYQLGDSPQL